MTSTQRTIAALALVAIALMLAVPPWTGAEGAYHWLLSEPPHRYLYTNGDVKLYDTPAINFARLLLQCATVAIIAAAALIAAGRER